MTTAPAPLAPSGNHTLLPRWGRGAILLALLLFSSSQLQAQGPGSPGQAPKDVKLVETTYDKLSSTDYNNVGEIAYKTDQKKWRHAETENFVVHYRRVTEAQRVVREIEFTLWYVASMLAIPAERYATKSHVFIFQDRKEWRQFLVESGTPLWSASFAYGRDLFLFVGSATEPFNSQLLAHEVTHAAIARFYPEKRLPRWFNEGFAEYIGTASIAARTKQYLKGLQNKVHGGTLSIETLVETIDYPTDEAAIHRFYQSSERFVRFLIATYPKENLASFIEALLEGRELLPAVNSAYGTNFESLSALQSAYNRFND